MTDETTARDRAAEVAEAEEWLRSVVAYPRRKRDVAPAAMALAELDRLRALAGAPTADMADFLRWLVAMDESSGAIAREARRSVTLTQIIDRARTLLAAAPEGVDTTDGYPHGEDPITIGHYVAESDGMDLEAQGEMADQLAAAQAAIQRVQDEIDAVVAGTISPAVAVTNIVRALDGDTAEEGR